MIQTIAKKKTLDRSVLQFMSVVWPNERITKAAKYTKRFIVRMPSKKSEVRRVILENFAWHSIDKKSCCLKSVVSVLHW